ncbi:Myb-like_protein [Hexamita inflata]|uniref:Myb-like protein n=1 Tax=Hexamita inflata TaxID=28002 RepID=A0AA86RCP5_9EUKA|nr:Myb-like protein [Hexamita inflata]
MDFSTEDYEFTTFEELPYRQPPTIQPQTTIQQTAVMDQIMQKLDLILKQQTEAELRIRTLETSIQQDRSDPQQWSDSEQKMYLKCLETIHKSNSAAISKILKTKTAKQVAAHSQRFFEKLGRHYNKECDDKEIKDMLQGCCALIQEIPQTLIQSALQPVSVLKSDDGKCGVQEYTEKYFANSKEIAKRFIQVLRPSQNATVAAICVAEKLVIKVEDVILCVIKAELCSCRDWKQE